MKKMTASILNTVLVTLIELSLLSSLLPVSYGELCSNKLDCREPECLSNSTVLAHTAVVNNSTVNHYMLGTAGYPTILFARSQAAGSCNASLHSLVVSKEEYLDDQKPGSVNFSDHFSFQSDYSFALVFRSLVEFNVYDSEANDSFCSSGCFPDSFWSSETFQCNVTMQTYQDAQKTANQTYCVRPLSDVAWNFLDGIDINGKAPQDSPEGNSGASVGLKFDPKSEKGQGSYFPTPFFTPSSMVLDMVLSGIGYSNHTTAKIHDTRLALEVLLVHGPGVEAGHIDQVFNSDDEYAPSVFYSTFYKTRHNASKLDAYLQWKSISYEDDTRKSSASQQALYNFQLPEDNPSEIPPSLARAFFGEQNVTTRRMFLVFGTNGDENGLKGDYFTWTLVLGTGPPAEESISAVVIIVIIVGFGLPMLMVVLGTGFLFGQKVVWKPLKKWRRKKDGGYQPIQ